MVQTKFVKYKTLKYSQSITQILNTAKILENYFLDIANESKFVKSRALEKLTSFTYGSFGHGKASSTCISLIGTIYVAHMFCTESSIYMQVAHNNMYTLYSLHISCKHFSC